ncbi:SecY subunit domain-containing protein [Scheffersomyces coipomensis]|uniref:SecY subunit domain-containing protein n=1 Tax=Scheffersomyces coipomensis TaxID=1788519 RepID=UPI00315D544A
MFPFCSMTIGTSRQFGFFILVRLLDLVKFFLPILPEVEFPYERISFDERVVFTVASGIIFLFGQLPIYGLVANAQFKIIDPLYNFRTIFAMEKGTLLELGLLPAITAGFIWQLAVGLKFLNVNLNLAKDRELFQTGQKLTSFFLSVVYTAGLIYSGYFDNVINGYDVLSDSLPLGWYAFIFVQIVGWSFFTTLLIEVFDKGYAFGSGILCFLTLQTATNVIKDLVGLEIFPLINSNKSETYGALSNLLKSFTSFDLTVLKQNIINAFTRSQLPNLTQFYISILSILVVIFLQNFRIEIPIRSTKVRAANNVYPIRLLYTGALPVLFTYTVIINIQIFGYFLVSILTKYNVSPSLVALIGKYNVPSFANNYQLTTGVLFYISNSSSIIASLLSPIKSVVYVAFSIVLSTWFSQKWCYISGSGPKDTSKLFKDQGISIAGKRDISITKELSRVIPVAAVSGAFSLIALALAGEILGGLGKGVSIIVGVSSAFGILEEFLLEYQQTGGNSQFSSAFGGL